MKLIFGYPKRNRWVKIFYSFLFISTFSLTSFAQYSYKKDFPILSGVYSFDKDTVDYMIVVDQSASIKPYWNEIKASIIKIINLAKESDYVTIIGFHSTADYLVLPRSINSNIKQELISEVNNLSEPKGAWTDLFESIDKTLESINRPNGSKLQAVFYFTDFKNDPPSGTKWNVRSIPSLSTKYTNYVTNTRKFVNVFAFQLPLDNQAGRDYEQLNNIFNNSVFRILANAGSMNEWFKRLSDQLKREQLKMLLKDEMNEFIEIKSVKTTRNKIILLVYSKLSVPVNLNGIIIKGNNTSELIKQQYSALQLNPKNLTEITVSAKLYLRNFPSLLNKKIIIDKPEFSFIYSFEAMKGELAKLNMIDQGSIDLKSPKSVDLKVGVPNWMIAIFVLLLILLLRLVYNTWIKPEWIFNRKGFKVTVSLNGKLLPNSNRTFETSTNPITIDHTIIKTSDTTPQMAKIIFDSKFKIFLDPTKPHFLSGKPKRGTYLFAEAEGINFEVKKSIRGETRFASLSSNRKTYTERILLYQGVTIISEFIIGTAKNKLEINFYDK